MDVADLLLTSPFPLENVTDGDIQAFCHSLWGWEFCNACSRSQTCLGPPCSRERWSRLEPFFLYYKSTTASYVPEFQFGTPGAIASHQDIADIIRCIRQNPTVPRLQLTNSHFASRYGDKAEATPAVEDQHRAFNLAIKLMAMVSCSIETQAGGLLESGVEPCIWRGDKNLLDFFSSAFPSRDHPTLNDRDESSDPDIKNRLTAVKLKKVAGLKFRGTSDLRNHLKLDPKTGVVEFFHYTSVLKEHLVASKDGHGDALGCNIPRQLALETLDSLQKIMFPLEPESQAMLRSLVSKQALDPDCLRFGSTSYRREGENDIKYQYWGSRIMDLYDEIENPRPRGYLETWLERRSKARHVMLATLVGVMIAIFLGMCGLVVGVFQAWVSYQAWQHPVVSTG
ncbi:hypothetical protein QBC47DRAFT_378211 [Echria macrotheca]|uniref:Uncharacterized protein n=1 Tax=Echria macrotheca TaxID=438768 RepID=A0AAJ0FCX5_9PEZI|nr:hypothetical protein QBC47DRAFT_378211 [Echria macrotheca]